MWSWNLGMDRGKGNLKMLLVIEGRVVNIFLFWVEINEILLKAFDFFFFDSGWEGDIDLKFCVILYISWAYYKKNFQFILTLVRNVVNFLLNFKKLKFMKFFWTVFIIYLFRRETRYRSEILCDLIYALSLLWKKFVIAFDTSEQRREFFLSFGKPKFIKFCLNAFLIFSWRRNKISIRNLVCFYFDKNF